MTKPTAVSDAPATDGATTTVQLPDGAPAIYALLIEAKKRIGGVRKEGRFATGDVSYNFRGVDQVTNAIAPVFMELGILGPSPEVEWSEHSVLEHEKSNARGSYIQYAYRHLVRVRYTFIAAIDGSMHECVTEGEAIDYSDKGTAKAMSVALRIAVLQALTLPTDDPDPDSERPEINKPSPVVELPPANKEHNELLKKWLKEQHADVQKAARSFIRSQSIPLARDLATDEQLQAIEAHAREVAEDIASRVEAGGK